MPPLPYILGVPIQSVGVVGGGLMGSGIAQVAAVAGCDTHLRELSDDLARQARGRIERSLAVGVDKGKLTAAQRDAALAHLSVGTDLAAVATCDLVIEAVVEDLAVKTALWSEVNARPPAPTIFATNTSSLTVTAMAVSSGRPDRMVGLHFFNPVPVMALVEVVRTIMSSEETVGRVTEWVRRLGKQPIAAHDTSGFVVNRLLVPYMLDAIRAVEQGVASVADIDTGMRLGAGHPMGPLTLLDFVGLDTTLRIAEIMFTEYRETRFAPPPLLRQMVTAGMYGRKSGRGFYDYSVDPPRVVPLRS
jgi:3-hydroxybutyryl-CoA dehydrogenase